jgi:hypothetical protein
MSAVLLSNKSVRTKLICADNQLRMHWEYDYEGL